MGTFILLGVLGIIGGIIVYFKVKANLEDNEDNDYTPDGKPNYVFRVHDATWIGVVMVIIGITLIIVGVALRNF